MQFDRAFAGTLALVLALSTAASAAGPTSCADLSEMSSADQRLTVLGVKDGFGAALGVFRSFAPKRAALMQDDGAKRGAEALASDFLLFIEEKRIPSSEEELVSRVVARCAQKRDQFAANSFVDVMLGLDKR